MNYYEFHIGDFKAATAHLTRIERSVYRDMIDMYYDTEYPLPLDFKMLCRKIAARQPDEQDAVQAVLDEYFIKTESGYFNDRCDAVIQKYHNNVSNKSQAGKASAAKREQERIKRIAELNKQATEEKQPSKSDATGDEHNSTGVEQVLESDATESNRVPTNQKPETRNQEPLTTKEHTGDAPHLESSQQDDSISFDAFWDLYDKKVGLEKSKAAWSKLNHETHKLIMAHVAAYKLAEPNKKFRKNPTVYFNGKCWMDEVILDEPKRLTVSTHPSDMDHSGMSFFGIPMSEVTANAMVGESEYMCAQRLNKAKNEPQLEHLDQPQKYQTDSFSGRLALITLKSLQDLDSTITRSQVEEEAKRHNGDVILAMKHLAAELRRGDDSAA